MYQAKKIAPNALTAIKKLEKNLFFTVMGGKKNSILIKATPDSFSTILARIIEPSVEASTWAFINHKCIPHIGILTSINPNIMV